MSWQISGANARLPEQFVVGEDGSWGLLYEQATAEGMPVTSLLHHILEYWWGGGRRLNPGTHPHTCFLSRNRLKKKEEPLPVFLGSAVFRWKVLLHLRGDDIPEKNSR